MKWSVLRCLIYIDLQSDWLGQNDLSCAVFQACMSQSPFSQHFRCICIWRHNARMSPVSSRVTNTRRGPDKISDGGPFVRRKMLSGGGGNLGTVFVFVFAGIMPPAVLVRQPARRQCFTFLQPSLLQCIFVFDCTACIRTFGFYIQYNNSHKNFQIECCLILYIFKCDP